MMYGRRFGGWPNRVNIESRIDFNVSAESHVRRLMATICKPVLFKLTKDSLNGDALIQKGIEDFEAASAFWVADEASNP